MKIEPGIFDEIIKLMGEKVSSSESDFGKFFTLALDEVALKSGSEMVYDMVSDSFLGDVTLPEHTGTASKALVFQIGKKVMENIRSGMDKLSIHIQNVLNAPRLQFTVLFAFDLF